MAAAGTRGRAGDTHADTKNLQALQRVDARVTGATRIAGHAVLYQFDQAGSKWATLDVEGPLFVAERSEAPLRRAIVLNRKGTTNLGISLGEGTSVDLKDKLVIVHVAAEVFGIWVSDAGELARLHVALSDGVKHAAGGDGSAAARGTRGGGAGAGGGGGGGAGKSPKPMTPSESVAAAAAGKTNGHRGARRRDKAVSPGVGARGRGAGAGGAAPSGAGAEKAAAVPAAVGRAAAAAGVVAVDREALKAAVIGLMDDDAFMGQLEAAYRGAAAARAAAHGKRRG